MTALTAARKYNGATVNGIRTLPCSSLTTFQGALLGRQRSTGLVVEWTGAAGVEFVGLAKSNTSSASTVDVVVDPGKLHIEGYDRSDGVSPTGGVTVAGASAATAAGDPVYCSTTNLEDLTLTATAGPPVGYVTRVVDASNTRCHVQLASAAESGGGGFTPGGEWQLDEDGDTKFVFSTDDTPVIDIAGDGNSHRLGGRVYAVTAASSAITNTATETAFDNVSYSIPGNRLLAGTLCKIRLQGIATAVSSASDLEVKLKLGGSEVASSGTVVPADSDLFIIDFWFTPRAAPGAAVACVGAGFAAMGTDEENSQVKPVYMPSTNLATNADIAVTVTGKWNVADPANSCRLDFMAIEIF